MAFKTTDMKEDGDLIFVYGVIPIFYIGITIQTEPIFIGGWVIGSRLSTVDTGFNHSSCSSHI